MNSFVIRFCETLCPCFYTNKLKTAYHSKIIEAENQSFGDEAIQHNNLNYHDHENKLIKNIYSEETPEDNDDENLISTQVEDNSMMEQQVREQSQQLTSSYLQCISEMHPYFSILKQKIILLPTIFDLNVDPQVKVPDTPYGLKVFNKQTQDDRINIFVYTFVFPTNYAFYEQMQNNFDLQKSFDTNIDQYQCKEIIDEDTKIVYLAYKKILIIAPRDFVYVRYSFKKGDENWSVACSLIDEEQIAGKTRGNIIMTATRAIQKDDQLYLSVYSQVDMKMGVKAAGTKQRGITEIKKYLDKCYAHIQQEKNNIL